MVYEWLLYWWMLQNKNVIHCIIQRNSIWPRHLVHAYLHSMASRPRVVQQWQLKAKLQNHCQKHARGRSNSHDINCKGVYSIINITLNLEYSRSLWHDKYFNTLHNYFRLKSTFARTQVCKIGVCLLETIGSFSKVHVRAISCTHTYKRSLSDNNIRV